MAESAGDAMGMLERRVPGDLERFKGFHESRGHENGAWRGSVNQGQANQPPMRH